MGTFRLAPEWARQDAVILVWPHSHTDWANADHTSQLQEVDKTYIEMTRYISRHQKLFLVAYDTNHQQQIQETLIQRDVRQDNIIYLQIHTNDTWVRDYGPIIVNSKVDSNIDSQDVSSNAATFLDFTFDAWGEKYSHHHDILFNQNFIKQSAISSPSLKIEFVLEGGNLEINNKGQLLSSSNCFKRTTTGKTTDLSSIENDFKTWFCKDIMWIHDVILQGDDTDGHIDTLARYCSDDIIVYSASGNNSDANNNTLHSLADQLSDFKQRYANSFELIPLPLPEPIFQDHEQLPASYTNFLITNDYVLVPVFNDKQDNYALKIIDELFPEKEIIDIESTTLIQQYGGIHCASMQLPACISYEDKVYELNQGSANSTANER